MLELGYYNGKYGPLQEMTIPMNDRVSFFGDGVYDAGPCRNYHIFALDEHVDRLFRNAEALRMNGILFFLDRPAGELVPDSERPLADSEEKILARLRERMPVYRSTCDVYVRNDVSAEDAAEKVLNALSAKC